MAKYRNIRPMTTNGAKSRVVKVECPTKTPKSGGGGASDTEPRTPKSGGRASHVPLGSDAYHG